MFTPNPYGCTCYDAYCSGAKPVDLTPECQAWKLANCTQENYPNGLPCDVVDLNTQIAQGTFAGVNLSGDPLKVGETIKYDPTGGGAVVRECQEGYAAISFPGDPITRCVKFTDEFDAGTFFTDVGIGIAQFVATGLSFAYGGPIGATVTSLRPLASYVQQETNMALDLGGIFGGVATALGGLESGSYLTALQGVGQAASGFLAQPTANPLPSYYPAAQPVYGPVYGPPAPIYQPPSQPVMSSLPQIAGTAMAGIVSKDAIKILLSKVAMALGKRGITLSRVMSIARAGLRYLTPAAVAGSLGLEVAELAILLSANSSRRRRRMNPANSKALRRAARRIKSFHRLCTHTDVLKGRRRSGFSRCGTCKKSPCRC